MSLTEKLFSLQDPAYQAFQRRLIPNIEPNTIVGVRTPDLRRLAKEMAGKEEFLQALPHRYFEENQIHGFLIANEQTFSQAIAYLEDFLPYVNNWATCDQLRPKAFNKNHSQLLPYIQRWLASGETYTIRFGIGMLICHYLDRDFRPDYLQWVANVDHEDNYVRMMVAWYFATALAKQYDAAFPYIADRRLSPWIHKKTIQKAMESYRITPQQKAVLKQYRAEDT